MDCFTEVTREGQVACSVTTLCCPQLALGLLKGPWGPVEGSHGVGWSVPVLSGPFVLETSTARLGSWCLASDSSSQTLRIQLPSLEIYQAWMLERCDALGVQGSLPRPSGHCLLGKDGVVSQAE